VPITYRIDRDRRLVVARGTGTLTDADVFGYQREVWSCPDVTGYDELVDMTAVESIVVPSAERVRDLAALLATMDPPSGASKFAIVAPQTVAYGLGRMYETNREVSPRGTKQVEIFRTMDEALAYLGVTGPIEV
jgi:hypothetical protein